MRWFKHMTDASNDEKLAMFVSEFGMKGYGIYWRILELIASQMDGSSGKCEVKYPAKLLRSYCVVRTPLLNKQLESLNNYGLISNKWDGDIVTLSCPKLLKYRDEYSDRVAKREAKLSGEYRDNVGSVSGHSASASSQEGKPMEDEGINYFDEAVKTAEARR